MLGKGLESLIPKKGGQNQQPPPQNFSISPAQDRTGLEEENFSSPETPQVAGLGPSFYGQNERRPATEDKRVSRWNERSGLRKGKLSSEQESVFHIEVEKIKPNPFQPRRDFNEEELRELAGSIREFGIIQPLVVSKLVKETDTGTEVEYQLIAGERRLLAAKLLGLPRVPAIVKSVDEHRAKLEMALVENLQRSDLNPIEEAKAYARLQDEFNLTQREVAARVGKSREAVANTMRLLNLPLHMQEAISLGKINESQARMLLSISNVGEQERTFAALLSQKLSVRALREKVEKTKIVDPQSEYWRKQFEDRIGAPVKLIKNGPRGKVILQFYSEEEWQNIISYFFGEENV